MSTELDELNKLILEDAKKRYSEKALGYLLEPKNAGPLKDANSQASLADSHGDELALWLKIVDDTIENASFYTKGCMTMVIAASGVTEMARGKKLDEALELTPKALRDFIGKTPRKTWHCTALAVDVLKMAIQNFILMRAFRGNDPNINVIQINL